MLRPGGSVLVAVSGGADSVALLHILHDLRQSLHIRLSVAHLNHSLRGRESDADAEFVLGLAEELGLRCAVEKVDIRARAEEDKLSLEETGREARRGFLRRVAKTECCGSIATGHHADDQAETVLIRLIRGAGVRGLAAMSPVSPEGIVRPLFECRREELRRHLRENGISYREDSSNLDRSHLRNRVRHDLIPVLEKEFNPSIVRLLCRTSQNMAEVENLLSSLADDALQQTLNGSNENTMSLDSEGLRTYDEVTWRYVFQGVYKTLTGDLQALSHTHLQALVDLVGRRPTGTAIHLPGGIRAEKRYGAVSIYRHTPCQEPARVEKEVILPGVTAFPDLGGVLETEILDRVDLPSDLRTTDPTVEFFDVKGISPPLVVRARRRGDRIRPFGFRGTKKLKDLLIDLKVPHENRDRLPLLTDRLGLLWVAGIRRSDRARITSKTREVLSAKWRSES